MKKFAAIMLVLSMVLVLTGCKNRDTACRWTPFKKDQTVCYTPCNMDNVPVVDECCPAACETVTPGCSTCTMGTPVATVPTVSTAPVVEPIPGT
ncbi:MAG: hypothetical protein J6A23_01725 [Thermoguttaceae bacterium]|nr:hypothetical protein [Thermoguttaceae bacterium]MBP3693557.1 hypothetical protein [Thermoguttaceae bacterium]